MVCRGHNGVPRRAGERNGWSIESMIYAAVRFGSREGVLGTIAPAHWPPPLEAQPAFCVNARRNLSRLLIAQPHLCIAISQDRCASLALRR